MPVDLAVRRHAPMIAGGRVWVETDVFAIDQRIKNGDESGWRGDPSMFLCWNPRNAMFEVWGTDRGGNQYLACSHHACDHTLLAKLVAGDPRRNDVVGQVLAENRKAQEQRSKDEQDFRKDLADRIGWAIRRDVNDGKHRVTSMHVKGR